MHFLSTIIIVWIIRGSTEQYNCNYMFEMSINLPVTIRAIPVDTFLDYIKEGCKITLMIAIDFTVSETVCQGTLFILQFISAGFKWSS